MKLVFTRNPRRVKLLLLFFSLILLSLIATLDYLTTIDEKRQFEAASF